MSTKAVRIVDIGRGPQIEAHRLTVMDVFYYLHRGHDFDFIQRAMPSLTREQFEAVVDYVNEHRDALVEEDRFVEERIKQGIAEQMDKGLHHEIDLSVPVDERAARLKEKLRKRLREQAEKTVVSLLVDANLDGHAELLDIRLRTATWQEVHNHLDIHFVHFEQAGLDRAARDDAVWRLCQREGFYLLTANRNRKSEDTLEATIRREGTPQSFPVFTFADANRIYQSAAYLDQVVETLLEYLLDEARIRGTGRLYLP